MNPTERQSGGAIGEFEIDGVGTAYAEINYSSFNTTGGIAQSGTFFNDEYQLLFGNSSLPAAWETSVQNAFINGANYADGGLTPNQEYCSDPADASTCGVWVGYATYVGKRNVEGGPRQDTIAVDAGRMEWVLKVKLVIKIGNMMFQCFMEKLIQVLFILMTSVLQKIS